MTRRLFDPAPVEGGGTPAPTPTPAPVDTTIRVDASQYTRILAELEQHRAASATAEQKRLADLEAAEQKRLADIAEREGVAAALKAQADDFRSKYEAATAEKAAIEGAVLSEKKAATLAQGIAAFPQKAVSPDAAAQVQVLLDARFAPSREDGQVVVRDKVTGRLAADVLPEILASPSYSHFFAAAQKGGSGAQGGDTPPAPAPATKPRNLGELAIQKLKAAQEAGQPLPRAFGGTGFFTTR